ncbi:MAG: D-alanyl-D-alanine carboxypeptidase/D-alanyl-D-alanine-endopeptidase [Oligoflexia bacterium]|nr:D-alanyl-D-alanine carboxypeptidase/D-alanyl-D-alanine-endopeptidase [Oligoflexia bacterium]
MKISLLLCVIGSFYFPASAATLNSKTVAEKMENIIAQSGIKKNHLGLLAKTLSGDEIFSLNAKNKMIPASITKLITAAAVLETFKPDHQFKTQIFYDSKGNLYLKGSGDPAFVSEKMWVLVNDFLRAGIKKVSGNIIVDESFFDSEKVDPAREEDSSDRAYNAPISALSFNWNSANIYVRPGASTGEKALVWADPENDYVVLKNKTITSAKKTDLNVDRDVLDGRDVITVSGQIGIKSEEKRVFKNITDPALYAGSNLKSFLKQRGIEVVGNVVRGSVLSNATLVASVDSDRLHDIITGMNKFSNNFIAEMLSKNMAADLTGRPGKMTVAVEKIKDFLKENLGILPSEYNLASVSGFSRKNSFTATHFTDLLVWAKKNFFIAPEFMHSLPIAGVDGTLEKRFKGTMGERSIRAKTGLLNGVVALSGYAGRKNGEEIVFTFMFNGSENEAHVRNVFDALATQLVK